MVNNWTCFESGKFTIPQSYTEKQQLINKLENIENLDLRISLEFKRLNLSNQEDICNNIKLSIECLKKQNGNNIITKIIYFFRNLFFKDFINDPVKIQQVLKDIEAYIDQTHSLIKHGQAIDGKIEEIKAKKAKKYPYSDNDKRFKEAKKQVFNPAESAEIRNKNLEKDSYSLDLAKALGIRKTLQQDYYTFTHGQQWEWTVVALIIKELIKLENPEIPLKHGQKYLRHQKHLSEKELKAVIHDHCHSNDLLCVDSDLLNTSDGESAIYFLKNRNVLSQKTNEPVNHKIMEILKKYISKPVAHQYILKKFETVIQEGKGRHNLVIICIPKEKIKEAGYLSLPYGSPLIKDALEEDSLDINHILDRQQAGEQVTVTLKKEIDSKKTVTPQFRLFTNKLNEEGIYSLFSRSFDKEKYSIAKKKVKMLALDIWRMHLYEKVYRENNLKIEDIDVFQYEKAVKI